MSVYNIRNRTTNGQRRPILPALPYEHPDGDGAGNGAIRMSKRKRRIRCPNCHELIRPENVRRYPAGGTVYIHEQRVRQRPFPHVDIIRSCYIKPAEKERPA